VAEDKREDAGLHNPWDRLMNTIGLCMIVKNEAAVIERCLDSVRALVDFVLVEDTGSTDGTQEVIKNWLRRQHLTGHVFDEPWRDFAHNRTLALEKLRKNYAVTYALTMDADDFIVYEQEFNPAIFKEQLSLDQYLVELREPRTRYDRLHLFRNDLPYCYRGVLHEFLEPPPGASWGRASGFHIESRREGARGHDPGKYRRDAELLERALIDETDPHMRARYTFYLGRSYGDCGEKEKALAAFLARSDQGFSNQEVYLSLYYAAQLQEALKLPFETAFATYQRASAAVPERAEARHGASRLCRIAGRHREGYEAGRQGLSLTQPADALFVETWIYEFGLLDEFSINAYLVGQYHEALDAGLRLLGESKFPAQARSRIFGNAQFAIDKVRSAGPAARGLTIAPAGAPAPLPLPAMPTAPRPRLTMPPVSVITPTGGRAAFLAQALEHFRSQDYPHLEWLILDDSPEPDRAFLALREPNIRYCHDAGVRLTIGEKRNKLVELATGEIIVHFDDDDFYAPCYISRMVDSLLENEADLINLRGWHLFDQRSGFFGYWDLMQKEGAHYHCGPSGTSLLLLNADNNQEFANSHLGFGFSYVYRKKIWEAGEFPHKDFNEDGEFALQAAVQFNVFGVYDTADNCLHVLHPDSTSRCYPQYRLPNFELLQKFPIFAQSLRREADQNAHGLASPYTVAARSKPAAASAAPPVSSTRADLHRVPDS